VSAVSSDCTLNRVLLELPTIRAHLAGTGLKAKIGGINIDRKALFGNLKGSVCPFWTGWRLGIRVETYPSAQRPLLEIVGVFVFERKGIQNDSQRNCEGRW